MFVDYANKCLFINFNVRPFTGANEHNELSKRTIYGIVEIVVV